MGAAFGLFAVFSMLRYRTAGIGMKDMTYLFIFIAIGLISGIQLEYHELAIIVGIIFVIILLFDTNLYSAKLERAQVRKNRNDKTRETGRTDRGTATRTGLNIHRITINEIDFLKDTAMITYYYYN